MDVIAWLSTRLERIETGPCHIAVRACVWSEPTGDWVIAAPGPPTPVTRPRPPDPLAEGGYDLLLYLDHGACRVTIGTTEQRVHGGQALACSAGQAVVIRPDADQSPVRLFAWWFRLDGAPAVGPPRCCGPAPGVAAFCDLIFHECRRNRSDRPVMLRHLFAGLMVAWRRGLEQSTGRPTLNADQIYDMEQTIYDDPGATYPSAYFAHRFGYSRVWFGRLVNATFGVPYRTWLLRQRMRHAANRLRRSEVGITELAEVCGYQDPSVFCRLFRRVYGCSPGRYRVAPSGVMPI